MSVLIKGGRIVTASEDYIADIFIENERISLIGTKAFQHCRTGQSLSLAV